MKTITINQLVKIMADKVGVEFQTNNFKDFYNFMNEIFTQFNFNYDDYDDMEYYSHECTEPEISVTGETSVFRNIYKDFESKFGRSESMEYYEMDADEGCETPFDINDSEMYLHYVNENSNKISEVVKFFENASRENNCIFTINAGEIDKVISPYCEHDLIWDIRPQGTESTSYFEIIDDNGEKLFDAIYWLCQNFLSDSFEDFENLAVELRYEGK